MLEETGAQLEETGTELEEAATHIQDWRFSRDQRGLYLTSFDGFWAFKLGGRLQLDAGALFPSGDVDGRFGFDGPAARFDARRARLYVRGTAGEHVAWKVQYDFAEELFADVYIALRDIGPIDLAHVGHFKEPFSLEELVSSNEILFMERGLPNALVTGRKTGAAALSAFLDNRLTTELGIFGDTSDIRQLGDTFSQTGSGFDLALRVTGLPWRRGPNRFLHLGFSYLHRVRSDEATRFRSPPESNLAPFLVDTGQFQSNGGNVYGLEAAYANDRFYLQGEWIHTDSKTVDFGRRAFHGMYVSAAWFLTDDHRLFQGQKGIWGRVTPKCSALEPGCWGAWEIAARFSRLDLTSGAIRGGVLNDWTLGLNWYLTDTIRVTGNWVLGYLESVGTTNILQVRAQVAY